MAKAPVSEAAGELGSRIRASRATRGWSLEDLGHVSGIHWSHVGEIERGQRDIRLHSLLILAAALQVDPADLVRGLRPPPRAGELD
ncbi:helix-turn-helix domain-containing protein [Prauserella flavalba]|uniref:helix-turn-helix domain-containing protein n=1 Tax=Prauserella flavalba TaxID=1477506 RepID=UPI0036EB3318